MNPQTWWYLARASGIVAWAMLTASVLWGVTLAARPRWRAVRPAWVLDLHRWLGGLSVTFTGIHLAALVTDSYVQFDVVDILVPFASSWKPGAVAWGVVAMWLLLAVEVTSLMMKRLPRRAWRAVHLTSYGLFWMATIHGITAGTDASHPVYVAAALAVVAASVAAVSGRVVTAALRARPA